MNEVEYPFSCPYCWKMISMLLDTSVPTQTYIEDCEGCCNPIEISYEAEEGTVTQFNAIRAQ
jgi:hypothetical protein